MKTRKTAAPAGRTIPRDEFLQALFRPPGRPRTESRELSAFAELGRLLAAREAAATDRSGEGQP